MCVHTRVVKGGRKGRAVRWVANYIHSSQLTPYLREDADVSSPDHIRLEKLKVSDIRVGALELAHFLDIFKFAGDERAVWVTLSMHERENGMAFIPAILLCEPAGRFGQEHHA